MSQESPNNTLTVQQEVTLEIINQVLKENFEKIHQLIAVMHQSSSMFLGHLVQLLNRIPSVPQIGEELVQQYLQTVEHEMKEEIEVETFLMPTSSLSSHHSTPTTSDAGSLSLPRLSIQQSIVCAECGKIFIRGSQSDSITKHAKESPCRPFGCQYCPRTFKKVSTLILKLIFFIQKNVP